MLNTKSRKSPTERAFQFDVNVEGGYNDYSTLESDSGPGFKDNYEDEEGLLGGPIQVRLDTQ
jgi:hypothetical protein